MSVRFAPSPTGMLHIGGTRIALACYLFARKTNCKSFLRIDDTDLSRSSDKYKDSIIEDLNWLGISFDEIIYQSNRLDLYNQKILQLKQQDRIYPCYETEEELAHKKKILLKSGKPPIYTPPSHDQIQKFIQSNRKPHWRFKISRDIVITWNDMIKGKISFKSDALSDPVIIREDGSMTYLLCSAIDDLNMNITHIVRGEDHISNTAIQIDMMHAIEATQIPKFAHISLMYDQRGKLSKRHGNFDIAQMRCNGIQDTTINNYLAKIGTSDSISMLNSMQDLIDEFEFSKFSASNISFDIHEIYRLNMNVLRNMNFSQIEHLIDTTQVLWDVIKTNIESLSEVAAWHDIMYKPMHTCMDQCTIDQEFISDAIATLPQEPWGHDTWKTWTQELKKISVLTGKKLFMSLRSTLTHRAQGPEMKNLLPILGRREVISRLRLHLLTDTKMQNPPREIE